MITNEILSAYIDGELSEQEMESVRSAIAGDELLAARLRQLGSVDRMLAEFSREIDKEPVPAEVLALLQATRGGAGPAGNAGSTGTVVAMSRGKRQRTAGMLALAATLVVAVTIGFRLHSTAERESGFDSFDRIVRIGPVEPTNPLHHALEQVASDNAYAAAPDSGISVTPVLSFVSTQREYCREFRVDSNARAARGLACRRNDRWETLKLAEVGAGNDPGDHYETATAETDAQFEAFVDGLVADAPLGADAERRLLQNRWRPSGQ